MKNILEILEYIETEYFWKEQIQFFAVVIDYSIKGLQNGFIG